MSSIVEKMSSSLDIAATEIMLLRECLEFQQRESRKFREALERIVLCVWDGKTDTAPTLAGWMQQVAREALATTEKCSALEATDKDSLTVDHVFDATKKV